MIERHLPANCYGQRAGDASPYITPSGILWHFISDKWGHYGDDPYSLESVFQLLSDYRLSYHELIDRDGSVIELVPTAPKCFRAWHAGESVWHGRRDCNDWTIGMTLMGMYGEPFTDAQYDRAIERTARHVQRFRTIRPENIVGHEDVAPGRKNDPGPSWKWGRYRQGTAGLWEPEGIT